MIVLGWHNSFYVDISLQFLNLRPNCRTLFMIWSSLSSSWLLKIFLHNVSFVWHGNRSHETSSNRGRLERFNTYLSKPDLDRLLNKALQSPSVGGGCVIPITVPYSGSTLIRETRVRFRMLLILDYQTTSP